MSTTKIDDLTRLNAFTYERNAVRVHRYKGIGIGRVIPSKTFVPNNAVVHVIEEGGKLEAADFWAKVLNIAFSYILLFLRINNEMESTEMIEFWFMNHITTI